MPLPCTLKERLLRASLALLCFVGALLVTGLDTRSPNFRGVDSMQLVLSGMVAIWSSALSHETTPLQSSTLAFLFLMLCGFCLQAVNPVTDKTAHSSAQALVQTRQRLGRPEEPFTSSVPEEPGAKFMKSTVASRMRSQAAQAAQPAQGLKTGPAACGERFQPEKESTKLKQDTPRRNEVDGKDQRERPQGDSHKNDKMCHKTHKTERQGIHSNTNCAFGRPRVSRRLLECFRACGRLLRRVHPRISNFWKLSICSNNFYKGIVSHCGNQTLKAGVEVQDLPGVSGGLGDARRDQESWRDLQPTNMTNTVKPLPTNMNPKQRMAGSMRQPDKNTSHEKLALKQHHGSISSHVPEQDCQERGYTRCFLPDHHTKFSIRHVFESNTLVPASFDKMENGSSNLHDETAVHRRPDMLVNHRPNYSAIVVWLMRT